MLLTAPAAPGASTGPSLKYHSRGPIPLPVPIVASLNVAVCSRAQSHESGSPNAARSSAPASSMARRAMTSAVSTVGVVVSSHHGDSGSWINCSRATQLHGLPT